MTLVLEMTPEMERQLREEAARRGHEMETYAFSLLQSALPEPSYQTRTPEERAHAFRDWAHSHVNIAAPPIPDEALRRENMYED